MSDKELLELAAKAAGLKFDAWSDKINDYDSQHYGGPALHGSSIGGQCDSWNPLTDDGDALRLGHKLGLFTDVQVWPSDLDDFRRAIVRAAAEIGKAMP